ncbi:glyoxalase [Nonlabens tegetincola]|uniref:VOC family protein n=1 Tax=Nonlabens tegetincola TaxID=323273 RepID=UPI000A209396|nr:VOC family protein [Nonlabens tegetincola]ARN72454.1 glyoxalase [Nonlabens tegetincola]
MAKVTGLGGIFFVCNDPERTKQWYQKHLGLNTDQYGCTFFMSEEVKREPKATQQWSPFPADTTYYPIDQKFMINYRVDDLEELLADLQNSGIQQEGDMQEFDYGKFAWIIDCDGRKVELWEPKQEELFEKQ